MHRLAAPAFCLLLLSAAAARAEAAAPVQADAAQAADHAHADHSAHGGQAPSTQARPTAADVQTKEVAYKQGDTELQGFLAWNTKAKGKRPGVLVVHEWWGHNEHARNQAKRLAEAGYTGFALDMYGKGRVATHPKDAQAFMAEATKDPAVVKARFEAALELLKKDPHVDPEKLAAIGYCFGGAVVLSMARMGEDLDAVASFHGALGQLPPPVAGGVKARVLVLNGADDPMVTKEQIAAFEKDMAAAGAKSELVNLKGAKHSFTNPDAAKAGMDALAYDAEADRESWRRMLEMFRQVFGS